MLLAVLSDSHDNIWKLKSAMPHLQRADAVIHCGDLCSPFVVKRLAEGLADKPIHIVWGNNDADTFLITRVSHPHAHVHLHGDFAELTLDSCRVAVNHYPRIAFGLAHSGLYDLVCHGHNHEAGTQQIGDCVLLNPGELMGMEGRSTIAFFDTQTRETTFVDIE